MYITYYQDQKSTDVVPGTEAKNGYCILSYCWEQSGEIIPKKQDVDSSHHSGKSSSVEYECIDQGKHKIIQTVVMIPEVKVNDPLDFEQVIPNHGVKARLDAITTSLHGSCWWKRRWTLEELMSSKPAAHFRDSPKQHDKIFALINIFPHMFDHIDIDYDKNVRAAFNDFYRYVITAGDLSLLCFGSNLGLDDLPYKFSTMDEHNLPSWTGVKGRHISAYVTTTIMGASYFVDNNMLLHIETKKYRHFIIERYDNTDPDKIDQQIQVVYSIVNRRGVNTESLPSW
ncbi:hypothetical protein BDA99DRAFT_603088 [Phascolomyces articulosus]|uniref:Heterokaryon incompatibility domain-containing protein n=1 Tax=Phascolomyces articulosus TaxID=60185 RepID=A0AAD5KET3_9FUNG|nr:hypothetical protein BDA99DRAFT_603088 [Phascolomyces articulosus]